MAKVSINITTGSLQQEEAIVGIDLGTTNSLVAYINTSGQPYALSNPEGQTIVPSIVHFTSSGERLVGDAGRQHLVDDPEHTVYSVKRLLGKSFNDVKQMQDFYGFKIIDEGKEGLVKIKIRNKFYSPIEISSFILRELKERAEHYLHTPVKRAVITVPAYFNDSQRQATRDAGKLAGLDVLRIINEPTSASLAYGIGLEKNTKKNIAVFDLGGGTFDISILALNNGIFEVLSTNGNTFLGGDDFDKKIVEYWIDKNNRDRSLVLTDKSLSQWLRLKAEESKKLLSTSAHESIVAEENGWILDLDIPTFENLINPLVDQTIDCCKNALKDSGLQLNEIETVVMVGGSTRTRLVKQEVKKYFLHSEIMDTLNPDEVVALGAAIEADILAGNRKDILLLDVTPLSLGIETLGGLMDVLIPRNSKIPTKATRQYTTSIDGQSNIRITAYQGERDLVNQNRKLASFDLKGIPAMPAGLPKVEISFLLNADGILSIGATELRSGIKQEVEVKPQYGLTDAEVEQMLLDSIVHAREDVETRMLLEAKTEAEQLIYLTQRFIDKNSEYLSAEEIEGTILQIQLLKDTFASEKKDTIMAAYEALNDYTKGFAERLMDQAIGQAMKGKKI